MTRNERIEDSIMLMIKMTTKFTPSVDFDIMKLEQVLRGQLKDKKQFGLSLFLLPEILKTMRGEFKRIQKNVLQQVIIEFEVPFEFSNSPNSKSPSLQLRAVREDEEGLMKLLSPEIGSRISPEVDAHSG